MAYQNDIVAQITGKANIWTALQSFGENIEVLQLISEFGANPTILRQIEGSYLAVRNLANTAYMGLRAGIIHAFDSIIIENMGAGANVRIHSNSTNQRTTVEDYLSVVANMYIYSNTAFGVTLQHNISAHRAVTFPDKDITIAGIDDVEAATLEEVANKEFIPLSLNIEDEATRAYYYDSASKAWRNTDNTNFVVMCILHEPVTKNGKNLHVKNVKVPINLANATNKLTAVTVYAMENDSDWAVINTDATDRTTKAIHESVFTAVDVGAYNMVGIELIFDVANAAQLMFQPPLIEVYYE